MKKVIVCLVALMLCMSMAVPAFATDFTQSVENKAAPAIIGTGLIILPDGTEIPLDEDCLVVTSVFEAMQGLDDERLAHVEEQLPQLYRQLRSGEMKMPYHLHNSNYGPEDMVIRDLFDITFLCGDHPQMLEEVGVVLELTFAVPGLKADQDISVMTYKPEEGGWNDIVKITNNGDETVTCVFEHLCPVAFSVGVGDGPIQTGDTNTLMVWGLVALGSLVAIAVLTYVYYRSTKKEIA